MRGARVSDEPRRETGLETRHGLGSSLATRAPPDDAPLLHLSVISSGFDHPRTTEHEARHATDECEQHDDDEIHEPLEGDAVRYL